MKKCLIAFALLASAMSSYGIVIRHDVADHNYQSSDKHIAALVTFTAVYEGQDYVVGSGTYIGNGWVLTAAHVAHFLALTDVAHVMGEKLTIKKVIRHEDWRDQHFGYDVALVNVSLPEQMVPAVTLFNTAVTEGDVIFISGRGDTGNGLQGIVKAKPTLRVAENKVQKVEGQWLSFDFSAPGDNAMPLEGIGGGGDSGSPAYLVIDGHIHIVGISSWQDTESTDWQQGRYGAVDYYTYINHYRDWIEKKLKADND